MSRKQKYSEGPAQREKDSFAKYLSEDEELILATGYSNYFLRQKFAIYFMIFGAIFILAGLGIAYQFEYQLVYGLTLGFIGALFFSYLKTVHVYHSHRYLLTTRRVMIKEGFFNVKLTSALYDKITHIEVDQGFVERIIMHHGTVIINTAGMNKVEIRLDFVDSPIEFKNLLERLINREREQYGRGTGPVVALEGEIVE